MDLLKSGTMQPAAVDVYTKLRNWLQWALVAFCFLVTLYRLEMPCNPMHKALYGIAYAKAEFHGVEATGAAADAQRQLKPLPQDPDWCSTKLRDVSSWVRASAAQPPFQFPKIIHQTVEDKYNISCEVLECMQTWKDMNPGYVHRLYDAKDREDFVARHYPEVLLMYRSLSTNVERADVWRYLALHHSGGVYADSDVRCTQPVSEWNAANNRDADLLVGVVYTDAVGMVTRVNNFVLAATPCHPVMAAMPFTTMTRIAAAGLANKSVGWEKGAALSEAVIGRTGPAALTATIADYARRMSAPWPVNGTQGAAGAGAGNLAATVRLMPRNVMTMGWETAAEKITCEEALARNPGAYICHQYFGTWKASYNHRPALTYSESCMYWGLGGVPRPSPPPLLGGGSAGWGAGVEDPFGFGQMAAGDGSSSSNSDAEDTAGDTDAAADADYAVADGEAQVW
ncbi:nucleotide-diphospho-sugar transferase [Scenedesmus sp. NREL 46B-D3]|nr:nucleotide-diphospho-sugar transferase [Scenedesmus sp. NREL 46B-D3]